MKKNKIQLILSLLVAGVFAVACAKSSDSATTDSTSGGGSASTTCETAYQTVSSPANGYQTLCTPAAGAGKFFRIEGSTVNLANKTFYVILGDSDANRVGTNTTPASAAGDGKFILHLAASNTGGPWTYFKFNNETTTQYTYPLHTISPLTPAYGPSTVCFEITDTVPPQVIFWANGLKTDGSVAQTGTTVDATVDCNNTATLTRANAVYSKVDWNFIKSLTSGSSYIKSSGTSLTDIAKVTKVFVSSQSVIGATDICSNAPTASAQLCAMASGQPRHVRMEGIKTAPSHTSSTLYTGYASMPAGGDAAVASGQSKFVFYHGTGIAGSPAAQTSVNFSNQAQAPATAFDAFAGSTAQTVCMDITSASPPRITVWATGVNSADCLSRATLTAANSILNKNDWTAAVTATATNNYIYLGAGVSTTKVTQYTSVLGTGFP